jgi:hypothetical protein
MDNIFIVAGLISFVFFVCKFIEMRFIDKESKPLKVLIRDSLVVYFSVIVGNFVIEQVTPVMENVTSSNHPVVFTDNPAF